LVKVKNNILFGYISNLHCYTYSLNTILLYLESQVFKGIAYILLMVFVAKI